MKPKPIYLLDDMLSITEEEKKSGLYIPHNHFTYSGCLDMNLLRKAIVKQLILITKDRQCILKAIKMGVNIIFQDFEGKRYYVYGSKTEKLGQVETSDTPFKTHQQKTQELIASLLPNKPCISGFHQITCL